MAKKKTTTVEEEVEEPLSPAQQAADKRTSEFLGEEVVNNEVVEKPTEEAKEEVKEEVTHETLPEETETVEFDPEQLKREAAAEARAEILKALSGNTDEQTQDNVDEYQKFQQAVWDKEKRQPTWTEAADFIKERAKAEIRAEQEAQRKQSEELTAKQQEEIKQQNEQTNKYVKDSMNELYETGKMPRIEDNDNPDDWGKRAEKAFFNKVIEVNQKRIADGIPPKTIKEVFYEDFKLPQRQVAGYDAPTNMGRGGYNPDDTNEEIDYQRDLQGKTFRQILMNPFKRN